MWIVPILILLVLVLLWPRLSRGSETRKTNSDAIDGQMVQKILESFQSKMPDLVPVNTIYVNAEGDKFKSRFMFLDGYRGVQYDITSDQNGTVTSYGLTSVSSTLQGPYKPYEPDSNSLKL